MRLARIVRSLVSSVTGSYEVLEFPYPYRSMLAINSDVEWTSWGMQEQLIEYLRNLGLDCSFSFWFYAGGDKTWSLFEAPGRQSKVFEQAVELMRGGVLDANHAFGGRRHCGGISFDRRDILSDYDVLAKHGVMTPIFSNHGSKQDTQNIGGDWGSYQEGDVPDSDSYHLDRTLAQGARFFWTDVDYVVDQPRLRPTFNSRDSLFRTQRCRDGNPIICFRRYLGRLTSGSCAQNIDQQLSPLLASTAPGYAILYQHLGVHRTEDGKPYSASDPVFPERCAEALEHLGKAHRSRTVLVTKTHRLLAHALMMAVKPWEIRKVGRKVEVFFERRGNAGGVDVRFSLADLSGWTVRVPKDSTVRAFYDGRDVSLERTSIDGACLYMVPWPS